MVKLKRRSIATQGQWLPAAGGAARARRTHPLAQPLLHFILLQHVLVNLLRHGRRSLLLPRCGRSVPYARGCKGSMRWGGRGTRWARRHGQAARFEQAAGDGGGASQGCRRGAGCVAALHAPGRLPREARDGRRRP